MLTLAQRKRTAFGTTAVALGVATAMLIPTTASAADVVSQSNGQLIDISVISSDITDIVAQLRGAVAVNPDASGDVIVDQPLDASLVAQLVALSAGSTNLFGDNGIISLGAAGQYAQANDDGSSFAFSGAVTQSSSLIGIDTVTPGAPIGTSGGSAEIHLSTAAILGTANLVDISVSVGTLAASAESDLDNNATGDYVLADVGLTVGGDLLSGTIASLNAPLNTLLATLNLFLATDIVNPLNADGTITITEEDLVAALGGTSLNDLPANTDLLSVVAGLAVAQVRDSVSSILTTAQSTFDGLGLVDRLVLGPVLTVAQGVLNPILAGLTTSLAGPLGTAISAIASLPVNVQTTNADGSFTETALSVRVGPTGSIATVDLASATVGPNADPALVPIFSADALMLGVPLMLVAAGVVWMVRRRSSRGVEA